MIRADLAGVVLTAGSRPTLRPLVDAALAMATGTVGVCAVAAASLGGSRWDPAGRIGLMGVALAVVLRLWLPFLPARHLGRVGVAFVTVASGLWSTLAVPLPAGGPWVAGAWLGIAVTLTPASQRGAALLGGGIGAALGGLLVGAPSLLGIVALVGAAACAQARTPERTYRLDRPLGGGLGRVWLGWDVTTGRRVAVKATGANSSGERHRARFEEEIRRTGSLSSPHAVRRLDHGWDPEHGPFMVLEYLPGHDLFDAVRTFGVLRPARVASLLIQACDALQEAHDAGFVHRDVKPSNFRLCALGDDTDLLKMMDLGLAHDVGAESTGGSLGYLAPEILAGGRASVASDLYALGCVGFFLLTGRRVFEGDELAKIRRGEAPRRPTAGDLGRTQVVPRELGGLILDAMSVAPEARPASARAFADALRALELPRADPSSERDWWARARDV